MTPDRAGEFARRNEGLAATDMVAFAEALGRVAPELGATSFPLADGQVVLCGPGMYVNEALRVGFDAVPSNTELERFEAAAGALGLPARFELHEHSHPDLARVLAERGYEAEPEDRTAGLALELDATHHTAPAEIVVDIVTSEDELAAWQAATASGWGHDTPARRLASDRFSAVAHLTQTPGLLLARNPEDGRIVGCASLSIHDSVAQLGGMSTLPAERGRGVQQALIQHRLQLARAAGCSLAVTHADADGGSIRNLHRLGFVTTHTKTAWSRPLG